MASFDDRVMDLLTTEWQSTGSLARQLTVGRGFDYVLLKTRRHLISLKKYAIIEQ